MQMAVIPYNTVQYSLDTLISGFLIVFSCLHTYISHKAFKHMINIGSSMYAIKGRPLQCLYRVPAVIRSEAIITNEVSAHIPHATATQIHRLIQS